MILRLCCIALLPALLLILFENGPLSAASELGMLSTRATPAHNSPPDSPKARIILSGKSMGKSEHGRAKRSECLTGIFGGDCKSSKQGAEQGGKNLNPIPATRKPNVGDKWPFWFALRELQRALHLGNPYRSADATRNR